MSTIGPRRGHRDPRVAIIGAGFGGIGLAVLLKKAGFNSFTLYEKAERVGGTWWYNQYPGAEVDTTSYVYSYAFKPHGWSRTHARQAELQAYLEETVDQFGVRAHLRLSTSVEAATWNEESRTWRIRLDTGEESDFDVLVAATGFLNIPKLPTWPGLDTFRGPKFHTSRWEHGHDLRGKTVAVVGTGSTSTQLVPELARVVKKLYLFQREPGWIVPKGERDHTPEEQAQLAKPLRYRMARLKWFWGAEKRVWHGDPWRPGSAANELGRQGALAFIEEQFEDRPDLAKAVTPNYPFWGKRLILNTTFYAALKEPNVELIPRAVAAATPGGVVDSHGVEYDVDVLVMATGFKTTEYLGTVKIYGSDGRSLHEHWAGEPRAFLGMTVPEFPNFYIMYGPGTNGGEIVSVLMRQAEHIVRSLKRLRRDTDSTLEVRPVWYAMYDAWLQAQVNATSWAASENYYKSASGRIVTQWPFSAGVYGLLVKALGRLSEKEHRSTPMKRRWTWLAPNRHQEVSSGIVIVRGEKADG
jgi:cation diffusion facilitator CzcD-associated flavoprotein CzcO